MAACGGLQHIFENPLPENPTLLETLSWNQIKPVKSNLEQSSFTEIFGELHFKETSLLPISSLEPPPNIETYIEKKNCVSPEKSEEKNRNPSMDYSFLSTPQGAKYTRCHRSSESLQLCTEGLGFESCDEVEDMTNETKEENYCREEEEEEKREKKQFSCQNLGSDFVKRSRSNNGQSRFPPPISSLNENGKPFVCFKSYREDGRFVLKGIRIPTQEFLHACREDGRLKLHFVHPNDEIPEEDEEEDEDEEEEEEDCGADDDEEICRSSD
ncbi:hypothetical protein UlMin_015676 [Ulmus minor]